MIYFGITSIDIAMQSKIETPEISRFQLNDSNIQKKIIPHISTLRILHLWILFVALKFGYIFVFVEIHKIISNRLIDHAE